MRRETIRLSIACPRSMPRPVRIFFTHSPAKIRIKSSSSERKKRLLPGSPWRPQRPRNWRSIRRASCRSDPMMCSPPLATTSRPSTFMCSRCSISATSPSHSLRGTSSRVGYFSCRSAQAKASGFPPRMMSVPRPAMFVAIVTAPRRPAWATISASRW